MAAVAYRVCVYAPLLAHCGCDRAVVIQWGMEQATCNKHIVQRAGLLV